MFLKVGNNIPEGRPELEDPKRIPSLRTLQHREDTRPAGGRQDADRSSVPTSAELPPPSPPPSLSSCILSFLSLRCV